MKASPKIHPSLKAGWAVLALGLFFPPAVLWSQTATQYSFTTIYGSSNYNVNQGITFHVQAKDAGNNPVTTYNGSATIGFYDTTTGLLSDPQALIGPGAVTGVGAVTGTAVLPFTNGALDFWAVFKSGSSSEQIYLQDNSVTQIKGSFPGSIGGAFSNAYHVTGFSQTYYLQDADMDSIPATYSAGTTNYDFLTTNQNAVTNSSDVNVTILYSSAGVTNASTFAVTGVNAGYAQNGAAVVPNFWFTNTTASTSPVSFWIILDYNGSLADYNNPPTTGPNADTIYEGGLPGVATYPNYSHITTFATVAGPASSTKPFMTNGQIIVRIWNSNLASPPVLMRYRTPNYPVSLSYINVPYSSNNIQPVQETVLPTQYLANASASVTCIFKNQTGNNVATIIYKLPANPGGTGVDWNFPAGTFPTSVPGYTGSSVAFSNPSGSTDGAVTLTFGSGQYLGNTQSATLAMPGTVTSVGGGAAWNFGMMAVTSATSTSLPADNSAAVVTTEGVPNTPSTLTAAAANFTGSGNSVSLSWGQVTNEGANGYILSRRTPAGSGVFSALVTIGSNATTVYADSTVTNLSSYDYTVAAKNNVTQSGAVTSNAVTPFANPGAPGPVTALTGGTSVQLNWTAPASVSGSYAVTGYQIWRDYSAAMTTASAIATLGLVTTYNDTTASAVTHYYYGLTSLDSQYSGGVPGAAHISPLSSPTVSGFPPGNPPNALAVSLANASPATLQLTWTAPVSNLNSPVSYLINRAVTTGASNPYTVVGVSGPPVTFLDNAVTAGSYYVYTVSGIGGGVTTNPAGPVTGLVGPPAPASLQATAYASSITLAWPAVANSAGETVASYEVYRGGVTIQNVGLGGATITTGDSSLVLGTDYYYRVAAVDTNGVTGALSVAVTTALLPLTPTGLGVTFNYGSDSVSITWAAPGSPEPNLANYFIYRNGVPDPPSIPAGTLSKVDSLVPSNAGTIFSYFVVASNDVGGLSSDSASVSLQIPPNPPATPTPTSSSAAITLTWTGNNASENVSQYTIYRYNGSSYVSVGSKPSTVTTFADTPANGVSTGTAYSYEITATNPGGESLKSAPATWGLLPQVPASLGVTIDSGGSNTVTFSWTNVTGVDPNASSVTVYVNGSAVTGLAASTTSYTDSGKAADTYYGYTLLTHNAYGNGVTAAAAVTQLTYPAAVTTAYVNPNSDGSRSVSWGTVGGGDVTSYKIYRALSGNSFQPLTQVSATGLAFPVTLAYPLQPGAVYIYKTTAVNNTGEGTNSNFVTNGAAPSIPQSVTAISGVSNAVTQVNLAWSDPATLAQGVTAFTVYKATTFTGTYSAAVSGLTTLAYSDGAVTGTGVYYYILAADSSNGQESPVTYTNAVAVTAFALPNPPGSPSATSATSAVTLSWTAASATTYPVSIYNINRISGGVTTILNAPSSVLTYTDSGLSNGTTYVYTLQTKDTSGNLSPASAAVTGTPLQPPFPPTNLNAAIGDQANQITWNAAVTGTNPIGGYQVFRSSPAAGGPYAPLTLLGPNATGYVDGAPPSTALTNGQAYYYYVVAEDNSGVTTGLHISANSVTVNGTPSVINLNPPSNVVASGGVSQVVLSWTDAFTGLGAPVTGYQLFRSTTPSAGYTVISSPVTGSSPFTDLTVTNGTPYYYYFVSHAGAATSSNSVTVMATPARPPSQPTGLVVVDGDTSESVSWAANTPVDNLAVTQYILYRNAVAAVTVYNASATVDNGRTDGTSYSYQVQAVNTNGVTSTLSPAVTGYPYGPFAPTALTTAAGTTAIAVTWTAPVSPNWTPLTGYDLIRTPLGGGTPMTIASAGVSVYDTTVTQAQLYAYAVLAVDNKGHLSALSSAVTDGAANLPAAPATLIVTAGDQQNLIDWPASAPVSGSLPVSEYQVTRSNSGGTTVFLTTQTWFLDTPIVNGSPVTYSIQAVDVTGRVSGNHISIATASVTGTGNTANLNPPTGLSAVATAPKNVKLTWALPNDQGKVVTGFNLFRSTSFNGPFVSPIANITNPPLAPVSLYNDGTASPNTTYYYVLQAVYASPATVSPNSNHAFVTTPAPAAGIPPVTTGVMAFDANLLKPLTGQVLGIYFVAPNSGPTEIDIYNISANPIRALFATASANTQVSLTWDGKDRNGNTVASGIYLIEIKAPGLHQVKKVLVVK